MLLRLCVMLALLFATIVPSNAADPIVVNAILSMTGPGAFLGQTEQKNLDIEIDMINKAGGVRGRMLKLNVLDDASNPPNAVQLIGPLIGKEQFILGPTITASCLAVAPLLKNGPVGYCLSPGIIPPAGSFQFSAGNNNDDNMIVLVRYLRERGWKRIAVLNATDATGQVVDKGMQIALGLPENRSVQLVAHEHFALGDVSVSAQMARIKAANPEALIAWANGTPFGTLLRGIQDSGLNVPIGASSGNLIYGLLKQFSPLLPKEIYFPGAAALSPEKVPPGPIRDNMQAGYVKALRAAGARPEMMSTLVWDPLMIYVDALKKLGPDASAEQIRKYIADLHSWVGINGIYDFRDGSQRGIGQITCVIDTYDAAKDQIIAVSRPGGYLR